jgi:hypothetical protein
MAGQAHFQFQALGGNPVDENPHQALAVRQGDQAMGLGRGYAEALGDLALRLTADMGQPGGACRQTEVLNFNIPTPSRHRLTRADALPMKIFLYIAIFFKLNMFLTIVKSDAGPQAQSADP